MARGGNRGERGLWGGWVWSAPGRCWAEKPPYPPRMLVLPAPVGSNANPTRGENRTQRFGTTPFGMPASPTNSAPTGALGYTVDFWPGRNAPRLSGPSLAFRNGSQRTPRLSVRRREIRQSSWAYKIGVHLNWNEEIGLFW